MPDVDHPVRTRAFDFLARITSHGRDVVPRAELLRGFDYLGRRVPLVGPQGIFKPAVMQDMPLSITTVAKVPGKDPPYEDVIWGDSLITYRYRGTNPDHHENAGLRRACETQTPLIYFIGIVPGQYFPSWPAYIVADDRESLAFTVAVDGDTRLVLPGAPPEAVSARRQYMTRLTRHRVLQAGFRKRVIHAYKRMCAVCRLRHEELLDAAHIVPYDRGDQDIPNGVALCKLHHSAFDQHIIGVRPDLVIEVNRRVLAEVDGPMLVHGLQGFHESRLIVPRRAELKPNQRYLEERYELFRSAG